MILLYILAIFIILALIILLKVINNLLNIVADRITELILKPFRKDKELYYYQKEED